MSNGPDCEAIDPMAGRTLQATVLPSPLPHQFVTSEQGVGGRLRVRAEDFAVDELPRYEPCGAGEHLFLRVRKRNLSHGDLIHRISKHFGISDRRIGFAGMKDKNAVTTQVISVHVPTDYDDREIDPRVQVMWAVRHRNKLRRGHLIGNRFRIRIREADPARAPQAGRILSKLEEVGGANYFGDQRFGYRCNNHLLGALAFRRDWKGLLDELLGTRGEPFPPHQKMWRELYDEGRFKEAALEMGHGGTSEQFALRQLARGKGTKRAVLAVRRTALSFWANAAQSAIFNRVVDSRIEEGSLAALGPGDLAWKHDSRGVFHVDEVEANNPELQDRLRRIEVSPSGPLWATGMTRASSAPGEREMVALSQMGLTEDDLVDPPCRLEGARRPMRERITNTAVASGTDEFGPFIEVGFDLPRGAYATVVLREIMKTHATVNSVD